MSKNHAASRHRAKLERKVSSRKQKLQILIVCEGLTEKLYFEEMGRELRLPSVTLKVRPGAWGQAPEDIIGYAESITSENNWDQVYCVIDRDEHTNFTKAHQKAAKLDGKIKNAENGVVIFQAIPSYPCFELWFLIHFESWRREENSKEIQRHLKKAFPTYQKTHPGMWKNLNINLPNALSHAKVLRDQQKDTNNDNPSTKVDLLVERLLELKQ